MHTIALVLACVDFAAYGARTKSDAEQLHDGPSVEHVRSQTLGNATPSSNSLAEVENSQPIARTAAPTSLTWLSLLLLAASKPVDSLELHQSRLFAGHGQLAPHGLSPEAAHSNNHALNNHRGWNSTIDVSAFQTSGSSSGNNFMRENAQAQKTNPTKLMQLPREDWLERWESLNSVNRNGDPTVIETSDHQRQGPSRFQRWSPVMSAAVIPRAPVLSRAPVLQRQRAPPAPPPPPKSRGRGGGDDGGGDDDGLHRLSDSQAVELLDDWIASTRVYCMSAQFGSAADAAFAAVHRKALEQLEALRSFTESEKDVSKLFRFSAQKQIMALYASDKKTVLALAGGVLHWEDGGMLWRRETLVIKYMSVNPLELDKESSTAALKLKDGLCQMANGRGADLILPGNNDNDLPSDCE